MSTVSTQSGALPKSSFEDSVYDLLLSRASRFSTLPLIILFEDPLYPLRLGSRGSYLFPSSELFTEVRKSSLLKVPSDGLDLTITIT